MHRPPRQHFVTLFAEEDTDTGHLLYEEWADAKLARVRLVPFDDSGRQTVYTADLTWRDQSEVRTGFLLAAGVLTGHTGALDGDDLGMVIVAGVDAQAWPVDQRERFVVERLEQVVSWRSEIPSLESS